jgi:DnaJ-class molecular chaperone|tara:strand:+ start:914 stop:1447 length:534 start_codon:yes stop_codon:yes gene_type:complete
MGMDVYGLNPTTKAPSRPEHDDYDSEDWKAYFDGQNEAGQYFRNNVWFWRPLWDYVSTACSDYITEEDLEYGHSNSGHIIGAEQCKAIANVLATKLLDGSVKEYMEERQKALDALPLDKCQHCEGTGERDDIHVQGTCNACHGEGEVKNFNTHYPFTIENVREFQIFAKNCGGFEIC